MNPKAKSYLSLARKARRLEAGEEPVAIACRAQHARLVVVAQDASEHTLRRVRSLEELVPGAYGIPEPGGDTEIIPLSAVSLLIVPLEGIDHRGMRLGKGGGYYDRLLADSHAMTLGAVMSWQWEEHLPAMPWDRPLRAAADCRGIHLF